MSTHGGTISQPCPTKETDDIKHLSDLVGRLSLQPCIKSSVQESPVNYSLKYTEENYQAQVNNHHQSDENEGSLDNRLKYRAVICHIDNESIIKFYYNTGFQIEKVQTIIAKYAGSEFDQPTDYSLRYAEEEGPKGYYIQHYCDNLSSDNSNLIEHRVSKTNNKALKDKTSYVSAVNCQVKEPLPDQTKEDNVVETPLMFSRCSSPESLSSYELPDDRGSIVSEFSRMTSGLVSPSELPDSPTQTVPPSPHNLKPPTVNQLTVFKECTSVYVEESTPVQFSTATSLSDLTFDDDVPAKTENKTVLDEDEDMHANGINIGTWYRKSSGKFGTALRNCSKLLISSTNLNPLHSVFSSEVSSDTTTIFCTEGTPANISHTTSQSDLSNFCSLSDDSDHENILAECIQSGMPQAQLRRKYSVKKFGKISLKSSPVPQIYQGPNRRVTKFVQTVTPNDSFGESYLDCIVEDMGKINGCKCSSPVSDACTSSPFEPAVDTLSVVSQESGSKALFDEDWIGEQEEALLEQCITSGMPKAKNGVAANKAKGVRRD